MKCMSCEATIDPKWKYSIQNNLCPFCGQLIMEDFLKDNLSILSETFDKLKEYSDHLDDWLQSNYGLVKLDSEFFKNAVKEALPKKREATVRYTSEQVNEDVEPIQMSEQAEKIYARAGVKLQQTSEKNNKLKDSVKQIKRAGGSISQAPDIDMMNASPEDLEDLRVWNEMHQNAGQTTNIDLTEALNYATSSLSPSSLDIDIKSSMSDDDDGDEIHPAAIALSNMKKGSYDQKSAADVEKLKNMYSKAHSSKSRMQGGNGSFGRA